MIRAVIFDLDDTLYLESEFFRSGFTAVANELDKRGFGPVRTVKGMLESIHFGEGREQVLSKASDRLKFPAEWVPELVDIFRRHTPLLSLAPDAVEAINRLRGRYRLGCVTDGFAAVQRRKISALGVEKLLDAIIVADDMGRACWKPSPAAILACCDRMGVPAGECVFVGDNPERDIRGARNAGMVSVRIRRIGGYFSDQSAPEDEASYEIVTLAEIESVLNKLEHEEVGCESS